MTPKVIMNRAEACQKLHDIALMELGVHETPGPKATAAILKYTKHTTLDAQSDETAWCASFMNFVTDTAGPIPGTHSAAAASFKTWGVPLDKPILGCLVVWDHHVTLCDHPDISNGIIRCLGGNQGNAVKVSRFKVAGAVFRSPV